MLNTLSLGALVTLDGALRQDLKRVASPGSYCAPLVSWLRTATAAAIDARTSGATAPPLVMPNLSAAEMTAARLMAVALALSFSESFLTRAAEERGRRLALTAEARAEIGECEAALMSLAGALEHLADMVAPGRVH